MTEEEKKEEEEAMKKFEPFKYVSDQNLKGWRISSARKSPGSLRSFCPI